MSRRRTVHWHHLRTEYGNCSYAVVDGSVIVRTAAGTRTTQLGGSTGESLARMMMYELSDPANDHWFV